MTYVPYRHLTTVMTDGEQGEDVSTIAAADGVRLDEFARCSVPLNAELA